MPFTMDDFKKLDSRLNTITSQKVEEFEISLDTPPTLEELPDSNKAYSLYASILFIDIRKSTQLVEESQARIMGVFLDSKDDNGNLIESSTDKAVRSAQAMQTSIDFALNKHLKNNVGGKTISCGIGIDYGKVLLTKVGMYGVEKDDSKENETDCVWVGNCTNRASKYSDLADGGEIFISENVYNKLSPDLKPENIWIPAAKHKANVLFNGYISQNNYLEFSNELGQPIVSTPGNNEDSFNIAVAVQQITEAWESISQKEGQLKALEAKLHEQAEQNRRMESGIRIDKNELSSRQESFYALLHSKLQQSYINSDYICSMGYDFWMNLIDELYAFGKIIGKSPDEVTAQNDCYLIVIYEHLKVYDKAYEAMVTMAKINRHWILIRRNTILWAKEQCLVWKLRSAIEARLKDYSKDCNRENFSKALDEIRGIVGY